MAEFKLSPSDFSFLWEECKRCFYLKVARGFGRPQGAFPRIFGAIDGAMTTCYNGMRTEEIAAGLPGGVVSFGQRWVCSQPIDAGVEGATCYIKGRFDSVVAFDDGSYGVIDFKTSSAQGAQIRLYSRQLHAYAYALENPAPGQFALAPITKLGLLVFEPNSFAHLPEGTANLLGTLTWIELPRDDAAFLKFLRQVASVLALPEPPPPSPVCPWCGYRQASRENGL